MQLATCNVITTFEAIWHVGCIQLFCPLGAQPFHKRWDESMGIGRESSVDPIATVMQCSALPRTLIFSANGHACRSIIKVFQRQHRANGAVHHVSELVQEIVGANPRAIVQCKFKEQIMLRTVNTMRLRRSMCSSCAQHLRVRVN